MKREDFEIRTWGADNDSWCIYLRGGEGKYLATSGVVVDMGNVRCADIRFSSESRAEETLTAFLLSHGGQSGSKPSNPKDALGVRKAPVSTIPWGPLYELGLAMLEGACKYGRHNYREMGVRASVYFDAAIGHLASWWEGEDNDPDSRLSHITKAMACLAVIRDSQMMGNWVDDRPPRYPGDIGKLMRNNPKVQEILDKYSNPVPPYTHKKEQ